MNQMSDTLEKLHLENKTLDLRLTPQIVEVTITYSTHVSSLKYKENKFSEEFWKDPAGCIIQVNDNFNSKYRKALIELKELEEEYKNFLSKTPYSLEDEY